MVVTCPVCTHPNVQVDEEGLIVASHDDPFNDEPCAQSGKPLEVKPDNPRKREHKHSDIV